MVLFVSLVSLAFRGKILHVCKYWWVIHWDSSSFWELEHSSETLNTIWREWNFNYHARMSALEFTCCCWESSIVPTKRKVWFERTTITIHTFWSHCCAYLYFYTQSSFRCISHLPRAQNQAKILKFTIFWSLHRCTKLKGKYLIDSPFFFFEITSIFLWRSAFYFDKFS